MITTEKQPELNPPAEKKIVSIYFSPTQTTQKTVAAIAEEMSLRLGHKIEEIPLTLPGQRKVDLPAFNEGDILIVGIPVYAGRIPQILEPLLDGLKGVGNPAAAVAVYGNRDYDDALLELYDTLNARGFKVFGAGAFLGEHSLSEIVGGGRPDVEDIKKAKEFGKAVAKKIAKGTAESLHIKGVRPYKERMPSMPCAPKTTEECIDCMVCAENCPAGVISFENPRLISDGCLRCCACVKICPTNAKYFDDELYVKFKGYLESNCTARKEPELFV